MHHCFRKPLIEQRALSQIRDKSGIRKYKVIAFSLYGDKDKYVIGAFENAQLARTLYPEWRCRFYYGPQVPKAAVEALKKLPHVEMKAMKRDVDKPINASGMMWRFSPAFLDPDVDVMIVRDTDSRLMPREVEAVDEWLASDKDFHIMRDHPLHKQKIMGGMWGCRNGALLSLKDKYLNYLHNGHYGDDQKFLAKVVYPKIQKTAMVHIGNKAPVFDSDPTPRGFPSPLSPGEFVGSVVPSDFPFWNKRKTVKQKKKVSS